MGSDGIEIKQPEPFADGRCPECGGRIATLVEWLPQEPPRVLVADCLACGRCHVRCGPDADTEVVLAWMRGRLRKTAPVP